MWDFARISGRVLFMMVCALPGAFAHEPGKGGGLDSTEVDRRINAGWPSLIREFEDLIRPGRSYIVAITRPPDTPFDLTSGEAMKASIRSRALGKGAIGHNMTGWSCVLPNGERMTGMAAITGERNHEMATMLKQGWGAGALLATYTDGDLEGPERLDLDFASWNQKGIPYTGIMLEVPTESCQRAAEFVRTFLEHPKNPRRNFSIFLDPLKFEGAGCGTFVSAVLSQTPEYQGVLKLMWREMIVGDNAFGVGLEHPEVGIPAVPERVRRLNLKQRKIPVLNFFAMNWNSLEGTRVRYFDPELWYLFMKTVSEDLRSATGTASLPTRKVFYYTDKNSFQYFPISKKLDANFDDQAARVVEAAHRWVDRWAGRNARASAVGWNSNSWGYLLETP